MEITNEATHKPVAILDGRDGKTLKEWLSKNKHVNSVMQHKNEKEVRLDFLFVHKGKFEKTLYT